MTKIKMLTPEPDLVFTSKAFDNYNYLVDNTDTFIVCLLIGKFDSDGLTVTNIVVPKQQAKTYDFPTEFECYKLSKEEVFLGVSYITKSSISGTYTDISSLKTDGEKLVKFCLEYSQQNYTNGYKIPWFVVMYENKQKLQFTSIYNFITDIEICDVDYCIDYIGGDEIREQIKNIKKYVYSPSTVSTTSTTAATVVKKEEPPCDLIKEKPQLSLFKV